MEEEMSSLLENETYDLVPRPETPVIGGRWVYCKKNEDTYKARYVAKGFSQIPNVDYHETFFPYSENGIYPSINEHCYGGGLGSSLNGCKKCVS